MALNENVISSLAKIAQMAYGSGTGDWIVGGAGRIGMINGHVVKFNTHWMERNFGPRANDTMFNACNDLRRELLRLAGNAHLDREAIAEIRDLLGLSPELPKTPEAAEMEIAGVHALLNREVVVDVVNLIADGHEDAVWDRVDKTGTKSVDYITGALNGGIGKLLASSKGGKPISGKARESNEVLARDVSDLLKGLVQCNLDGDRVECRFGGKFISLAFEGRESKVVATIYDGLVQRQVDLDVSAAELTAHLAELAGVREDVFEDHYSEILNAIPNDPDARVSTEMSPLRGLCGRIIQRYSGVPANRLANVTTANLIDIARDVMSLYRTTGAGVFSGKKEDTFSAIARNRADGDAAQPERNQTNLEKAYLGKVSDLSASPGIKLHKMNRIGGESVDDVGLGVGNRREGGAAPAQPQVQQPQAQPAQPQVQQPQARPAASMTAFLNRAQPRVTVAELGRQAGFTFNSGVGYQNEWEIVTPARKIVEARIEELERLNVRKYISSEDAKAMIDAMHKDARASEKVVIKADFNLEKKVGHDVDEAQRPVEAHRQALRDLAADLFLAEDSTIHDGGSAQGNLGRGREMAKVLVRHAKTLAKLMIDYYSNPPGSREAVFAGLCPEAKRGLEALLGNMRFTDQRAFLGFHFESLDSQLVNLNNLVIDNAEGEDGLDEAEVRRAYRESKENSIAAQLEREFANASRLNLVRLETAKQFIDDQANDMVNDVQDDIVQQVDGAFRGGVVGNVLEIHTIDDMFNNANIPDDTGYIGFVKRLLREYFASADPLDKKAMCAAALRYMPGVTGNRGVDQMRQFAAMLKGAGPLLQKILQGLDESLFSDGNPLANAIKDMKTNLAPIPEDVVKASLRDIVDRSGGNITKIEAEKTLGCASIGQAILCKVYGRDLPADGKEIVVKVLRPDALRRIEREKGLVLRVAREGGVEDSYKAQLANILEEFDFKHEAKNIEAGKVYENRKAHPHTGAVKLEKLTEPATTTLAMEKAPGKTAEGVFDEIDAILKDDGATVEQLKAEHDQVLAMQRHLCDMAKVWVTEGLYGSGFFHGDLHSGNIMLDREQGATMIDFGNVTQLSKFEQENVTKMMAAAACIADPPDQPQLPPEPTAEQVALYNAKWAKFQDAVVKRNAALPVCVKNFMEGLIALLPASKRNMFDDNVEGGHERRANVEMMLYRVLSTGGSQDAGKRIYVALVELQRLHIDIPGTIFKFSQSQMRLQLTIDKMNSKLDRLKSSIGSKYDNLGHIDTYLSNGGINFSKLIEKLRRACANIADYQHGGSKRDGYISSITTLRDDFAATLLDFRDTTETNMIFMLVNRPPAEKDNHETNLEHFVSLSQDAELLGLWVQLIYARNNGEDTVEPQRLFLDRLVEVVRMHIDPMFEGLQELAKSLGSEPDNFIDCMSTVICQNLWASKNRIPSELRRAL